MKLRDAPPVHLTYCLNVHPGESWAANFDAIRGPACKIRDLIGRPGDFGLGLRLGAQAAKELAQPGKTQELREFLQRKGMYAFTINGFPYGTFHGKLVKQDVYHPDWRDPARREYTLALANILADLLPEGMTGSISTVPGSYRSWIKNQDDVYAICDSLAQAGGELARLRRDRGKEIVLALEPEPDCLIEDTPGAIEFFRRLLQCSDETEDVRRHVGLCLDTAHLAVAFENPHTSLQRIQQEGIRLAKVQLSAALRLPPTAEAMAGLRAFQDPVYLHQVKARMGDGTIRSWADLPDVLADPEADQADEWRVHFHVPLFWTGAGAALAGKGGLASTAGEMTGTFAADLSGGACPHLEIETYTWTVLPDSMRPGGVEEGIAREYQWALRLLHADATPESP